MSDTPPRPADAPVSPAGAAAGPTDASAPLTETLRIGSATAPSRVVFGPHETNLGRGRAISERHVAYYERRAAGGAGVIVTEEASVHESDWPYERAPLASECAEGWRAVVQACGPHGTVVLAALGHAGGQGTSHWSQRELWAPGRVPEVNTREVPKEMEERDIEAVISGFVEGARTAVEAGCHGVEINAGQHSLARQFLSGLTNTRGDHWGTDRSAFLRRVIAEVRDEIGPERVLALRLSCDELAPWAGITPEMAPGIASELIIPHTPEGVAGGSPPAGPANSGAEGGTGARSAPDGEPTPGTVHPRGPLVDMLTVVRGSIYTAGATRPDGHTPEGFNSELAAVVAEAVGTASGGHTVVVAQGSIVEPAMAGSLIAQSAVGAVEMTRAQIADAELVAKLRAGEPDRVRPCVLCNQLCAVRDNRNPIVSCVVDPFSGHETTESIPVTRAFISRRVLLAGGGPAGLEAARVAAGQGHSVRLIERHDRLGGALHATAAQPGRHRFARFAQWLESECRRAGVEISTGVEVAATDGDPGDHLVVATGGRPGDPEYAVTSAATVLDAARVLEDPAAVPGGDVLVWDPIGGPTGVAVAEVLTARSDSQVHLVTPDYIVGNELARSGDLGPANARLAAAGVELHRRRILRKVRKADAVIADRFSKDTETLEVACVVDCGHRLPDESLAQEILAVTGHRPVTAGDCVAPRSVGEAVLEGRRRALEID